MVMGYSVMFFGCLCPGCGLGFLWMFLVAPECGLWFVVDGVVVGGACPAGVCIWVSCCCPFPSFREGAVPLSGFLGPQII